MSTVTSCTLVSSGPAISSGRQLRQSWRPAAAAAAPLSSQRMSRPLSVCWAISAKGDHNPKTDLHPFNISPVVLVNPVPPREERWQLEEYPGKVDLWFEVPGQSRDDLAVEIDEDILVIKKKTAGMAGQQQAGGGSGPTDYRPQANRGTKATGAAAGKEAAAAPGGEVIYARLLLPAGYSKEGVEAELKSGVLRVSIAKVKEQARRKITVNIDVN